MQITKNWRKCSLRYILFIQYQGYDRKMKRGKSFNACGMDGCSIALDFFACISFINAAYRFSVSWILRLRVSAFRLQLAMTVLCVLASSYTKTKGLDKERLRQMILQYLSNAGDEGAKRDSIYEYLKDVLPANKTEEQQLRYVGRLLVELNEEKQIGRIGLKWILKDYNRSV